MPNLLPVNQCKLAKTLLIFASLLTSCFSAQCCWGDITISGYTDATNDRFAVDSLGHGFPTFIAANFNLSGIGQSSNGQWATAISRNVIITAAHFTPGVGATIYFFSDNNPAGTEVTSQIVSGVQIGSTDLYLGVLDHELPSSIVSYAFAQESLTGPVPVGGNSVIVDAGSLQGLDSYMFGRSPATHVALQDQAVGRNLITGYSENVPFTGSDNDSLLMIDDAFPTPGPNAVPYEAYFQGGDSGGPTFVDINGALVLIGTNAFQFNGVDFQNTPFRGSGINYTGNQAAFINNFIAIHAVPEPSAIYLVAFGLLLVLSRRLFLNSRKRVYPAEAKS